PDRPTLTLAKQTARHDLALLRAVARRVLQDAGPRGGSMPGDCPRRWRPRPGDAMLVGSRFPAGPGDPPVPGASDPRGRGPREPRHAMTPVTRAVRTLAVLLAPLVLLAVYRSLPSRGPSRLGV